MGGRDVGMIYYIHIHMYTYECVVYHLGLQLYFPILYFPIYHTPRFRLQYPQDP